MSNSTLLSEDDVAFERRLLGAGQADRLPHARTEAALLRFATGIATLEGSARGAAAKGSFASSGSARSRFTAAAKWVALGVLAGGMGTFAWLRQTPPTPITHASVAARVAQPAAQSSATPAPAPTQRMAPAPSLSLATERAPRTSSAARFPAKSGADLAAEVTALDGIRTALSIGALRDAEQRLVSYRRDFAHGALRSEAEVLAIEVMVAQGRTQSASRAAERFIAQHPRDPQVARVRSLLE